MSNILDLRGTKIDVIMHTNTSFKMSLQLKTTTMKTLILILFSALTISAQDTTIVSYSKPTKQGKLKVVETQRYNDKTVTTVRDITLEDVQKEMEKELQNVEMMQQEETFLMEQIEYLRERIIDNRRNMRLSQRKLQELNKLK
jgi:hypothetical protein